MVSIATARSRLKSTIYDLLPASRMVRRGPATERRVALTFDDGPDGMTEAYLDALDRLGVPGTFFLVGEHAERHPDLVREYIRRGHQIAGHGFDHWRFPSLTVRQLHTQLVRTDAAIGPQPTARPWIRPPYGAVNARVLATMLASGYMIALWSLDSLDYADHHPENLIDRCAPERVTPGEILLFHEGQRWTLDALPRIVEGLRAAGYECVTMADLITP